VSAQAPIPNRPDGYGTGGPTSAPVVVEAFYDMMCPDSRASWPTIPQLIAHYGSNVHFRFHTFALPFHTNSFFANQGAHVIAHYNASAVYDYMNAIYAAQDSFGNSVTADLTINTVLANMGAMVEKADLMPAAAFVAGLNDATLNWETRVSYKYGCSRAVVNTPTYLVNGVTLASNPASLSDWTFVLDPLLASTSPATIQPSSVPVVSAPVVTKATPVKVPLKQRKTSKCAPTRVHTYFTSDCPATKPKCVYSPGKFECCLPSEMCIPNVGCRC